MFRQPWHTLVKPSRTFRIGSAAIELYPLAHTSLHRIKADALVLACDKTLRMVKGARKQVRDYAGEALIEREAIQFAPLPPGGVAKTQAGRSRFGFVLHANIFDETMLTNADLQREALLNAFQTAAQLGATSVALVDYTPDLRRAVAEETSRVIAETLELIPATILIVKLLCFDPTNAWVFQRALGWFERHGFENLPDSVKIRHTLLQIVGDAGGRIPGYLQIPADALFHATDANLSLDGARSNISQGLKRWGGSELLHWIHDVGTLSPGDATYTRGGKLPIPWVLHLNVTGADGSFSEESLRNAVHKACEIAHEQTLRTIVVTPLRQGDSARNAQVIVDTIDQYLHSVISKIERVLFYAGSDQEANDWRAALNNLHQRVALPAPDRELLAIE